MTVPPASDVRDALIRRAEFVASLADGPREKRALAETLDCSRSTVDRAVRELETLALVAPSAGGYELTETGRRALSEYRRFERRLDSLLDLVPLLRWMPPGEFDVDVAWLADADVVGPEAADPYAMVNRHVRALESAASVRAMLPVTGLHAVEAAHASVVEGDAEHTLVVETAVAETLRESAGYAELTAEMTATGRVDLYAYDGDIPYFLGVFDGETVQVGVDDRGDPRALLESTSPRLREWADERLRTYRERATLLD